MSHYQINTAACASIRRLRSIDDSTDQSTLEREGSGIKSIRREATCSKLMRLKEPRSSGSVLVLYSGSHYDKEWSGRPARAQEPYHRGRRLRLSSMSIFQEVDRMQRRMTPDILRETASLGLNALMAPSWQTADSSSMMAYSGTADFPSIHQRGRSDSSQAIVSRPRINNPYESFSKEYTEHSQEGLLRTRAPKRFVKKTSCQKILQWTSPRGPFSNLFSLAALRKCSMRHGTFESYLLFAIEPAAIPPEAISSRIVPRVLRPRGAANCRAQAK
jgi:hypothetical protein